ncbi:MAG: DUF1553 domain-containing protein [Bryobacteraceae bacterium]
MNRADLSIAPRSPRQPGAALSLAVAGALLAATALPAANLEFNRDVRPILSGRCFTCHGPDRNTRKSALRLDLEASAKAGLGKGRRGIVPGSPARSEVYKRIVSTSKTLRMPPAYAGHDALTPRDIGVIERWIEQGAAYQKHWSFLPPERPSIPAISGTGPRNAIDHFLLARLEREGLRRMPEADRPTLIRRLSLDLTGLPPTPAEALAFLNDASPQAYETVVDRLLASPRYAERMAIRWLEGARYADTNGYQSDGPRDMWRWRDWVIDAFHRNMPFDQFTIEQIAGDLLPNASVSQKVATAFHRNHRTTAEGGIVDEEFRVEYVADRVETTGAVWLGLTVGCARCHDHKFDPITQREFYQLFAFFNNVPERGFVFNFGNEEPYIKAPLPEQQAKLDEFDRRVAESESRVTKLQPAVDKTRARWEKKIAKAKKPLDWNVRDGLVFHEALDSAKTLPVEPGRVGQAVHFDGKGFVNSGDVAKFNFREPFTFAAWIKPESNKGAILSRAEDYFQGTGHALHLLDGRIRLHVTYRWSDLGMRLETVDPVKLNEWQHVMVSYDGKMRAAGVHIYVDGRPVPLKILFDYCIWPIDSKEPFRIGAGGGLRFKGSIDDVRVYNRALTPDEAAVVPLLDSLSRIAAQEQRSKPQVDKLRMAFLDRYAPPKVLQARAALAAIERKRAAFYETVPTVMVMAERQQPRDTFLLRRGAYDAPGEKVTAAVPGFLGVWRPQWPLNRLGLARWLVDRSNPLTARVIVNRYWQMFFGQGLVKTVEDFGSQGEWPAHAELLDWLAVEFIESGWDVKHILKTMVMSAAYRQSSRVTPELLQKDPENRLLARGPRIRLAPEMIRDQALAVSGLLVEKAGGPSVRPYQPPGLWQELQGGKGYEPDKGEGLYRRTIYTYWKRTVAPPSMVNFDSPNRETCVVRQSRTNTPLQALNLMNDVTYVEAARKLAERMLLEGGASPAERIDYGFRLALARPATEPERRIAGRVLGKFESHYRGHADDALALLKQGDATSNPKLVPADIAAYAGVASLILNLDETVTKE